MQLLRYFDPTLQKIKTVKEIKTNAGASTGRYTIFFSDPKEAQKFVSRYDNDFFNTEEINIPLRAHIFEIRKKSEGESALQQTYKSVQDSL